MTKYLLIFGAGASYGSDDENFTPPLAGRLLEALSRFNPDGWGKIPDNVLKNLENDFESGMFELSSKYPHSMPPLHRAMAAYFFNFLPRTSNLYYLLAQKLFQNDWNGAIVSLNYERLFEISLSAAGVQPYIGTSPNQNKKVEICLPHGCCHIFCESVRGNASAISFSGMNVFTNGPIKIIGNPAEFQQRIQNDAFPPVMSYFESKKRTTSGNNFISNQRARYSELVNGADIIILVGIRVREHDKHIWEPLGKTGAKLIYISGRTSGQEFREWSEKVRPNYENEIIDGYFKDSYDIITENLGL